MMNKCTCGNLGHGLCSSWCDLNQKPIEMAVPTHDVSGTRFIPGTTNLSADVLYDALIEFNIQPPSTFNPNFLLKVSASLHSRLRKCNLLTPLSTDINHFQGITVEVDSSLPCGRIQDVTIFNRGQLVGKIIVREC